MKQLYTRLIIVALFLFGGANLHAQSQLRIEGRAKQDNNAIIPKTKVDINGQQVAGIKILTDLTGFSFDSPNGIVEVEDKKGEYTVFLSPNERKLTIRASGFEPFSLILSELGVKLRSGQMWVIKVTGERKLEIIPINIVSTPTDSRKIIDGKDEGTGRQFQLSIGKHSLRLEKEGYASQQHTIEVNPQKTLFEYALKEVELVPVTIRSTPKGATIFVDGVERGTTDDAFFGYPGTFTVRWILSGYVEQSRTIEVTAEGKNEFSAQLEKNTAIISWQIRPSNAAVSINKMDFTGKTSAELAPGKYLLEIAAPGYDSQSESVDLKRGETLRKNWSLTQQTGGLQFSIKPIDATVTLQRNGATVETWKGLKILRDLPVGSYTLKAGMNGYETANQTITITRDKTEKVEMTLKKSAVTSGGKATGGKATGKTYTNSIGMEFVLIPAGTFQMGSNVGKDDEKPVHSVMISKEFYLGKYEVTQKQWQAVMGALAGLNNPSRFKGDNLPVENVSWNDIQEFVKKLNLKEGGQKYRLPTEAEWEYAARAGTSTKWSFGNSANQLNEYGWYSSNIGSKTHPVGQKKPNPWGLYDMHGNLWEWVQDWYGSDYYTNSPKSDPQGPSSGSYRVLRGGSWSNFAEYTRSAGRSSLIPVSRDSYYGFRLLMVAQ